MELGERRYRVNAVEVPRRETVAAIATWFALGALLAYRVSSETVDLDLYHQMALIREWINSGSLARADVYAFTPTITPFIHHEWGAGGVAYFVSAAFGGAGILILRHALALAAAAVVARVALRSGAERESLWALAFVGIGLVELGYSPVRAQAYSFLFAAVTLYCCERDRSGAPRALWPLAPMFVVWVNVHGGFVVGPILLLLYAAERVLQRQPYAHVLLFVVLLLALTSATPYGFTYYGHMLRSLTHDRQLVSEWDPLWASSAFDQAQVAFGLSVLFACYGLLYGRRTRPDGLLIVLCTGLLAIKHQRMLPFYGIAWFAYCSAWLRGTSLLALLQRQVQTRPLTLLATSVGLAVVASILLIRNEPIHLRVPNEPSEGGTDAGPYYPVGAVNFLRATGFEGKLLTPFDQGAYVLWKLYPHVRISLDSRYEAAYPQHVVEELTRLYATGIGATETLQRYDPDLVLVPLRSGLARVDVGWARVYQDRAFALLAKPGVQLAFIPEEVPCVDTFP